MKKWIVEDWEFELTALDGKAAHCRLGIEKGDRFVFSYECPAGMCPRLMSQVYTWCEVIRCGGDFTYRGSKEKYEMDMIHSPAQPRRDADPPSPKAAQCRSPRP